MTRSLAEYEVEWDNYLCFIMLRVKGHIKIRILDKKHRRAWDSHMMEEQNTTDAVSKNKKERNQTSHHLAVTTRQENKSC